MPLTSVEAGVGFLATLFSQALLAAIVSTAILLAATAVYRLVFHPLSAVPGPRWAAVSNFWYAYQIRNGRTVQLGKTLHRRYGPVVRIGPNEICFNSKEAFQAIYVTGSGYEKSDFYLATSLTKPQLDWKLQPHFSDTLDLLSDSNMKRYRLQRRLIGPIYQKSNVVQYEAAIDSAMKQAIVTLKSLNGAEVSLNEWMHIISVECLGAAVLSWSPSLLKNETDFGSGPHAYQAWRRKSVFGLFPNVVKLEFWSKNVGRVFSSAWGVNFKTPKNFRPFFPDVSKKVNRRANAAMRPKPPRDDRRDIMADLVQLNKSKPVFSDMYLRRMAMTNFGAGHETLTSTLTAIVAMLGSRDDVQARVSKELLHQDSPTDYSNAAELLSTQSLIKESRRLYPVASMSLPRRVPPSGLHLHGFFFPPGTTVGCNPVALHRNVDIFGSDAEEFSLDRWLGADAEAAREMDRYGLGWGGGHRICPGRHLAELIVFKVLAALVKEFQIETEIPPEGGMKSYFLSMLTGVKVRFVERDTA
ncbi:hypothetical protein G7046_g5793 [Stylonectria norvegica]|nr:hypothetical protein G7046_g5793 [Stylonectria norvegica]